MARLTKSRSLEPVINAAQKWIRDCLIADESLFSTELLWTPETVAEVHRAFVDHPAEGTDDFRTKLKGQMAPASPSAKRLMAEMIWSLLLFPSNIKISTKQQQVSEMWSMSGKELGEGQSLLSDDVLAGIGSGGPGFNNHRWRELIFLISLVGNLKELPSRERHKVMSDYETFVEWIAHVPDERHRQFRHMLRFFCFPDRVERISSNRERGGLLAGFGVATKKDVKEWGDQKFDDALLALRKTLEAEHPDEVLDFYEAPLRERWRPIEEEQTENGVTRRFWVEKTIAEDRPDRNEGPHSLGKALWSPQRADGNRDIYRLMREVREGDIVFHFVDNKELRGISVASSHADDSFVGVEGTEWAGRKSYRIPLREYRQLTLPIHRSEFLANNNYRTRISNMLEQHRGLFFNKEFNLNQGSYLTEAPTELVQLWDEIYRQKAGGALFPGIDLVSLCPVNSATEPTNHEPFDSKSVDAFEYALRQGGVIVSRTLIVRLLSSLVSKNLVLLTGLAGSGKTKIAQALARWLPSSSNCFRVVAVGADWTGNENVLGYPNGLEEGSYISKPSLEVILHAKANQAIPHFLILDEMNLSHVERYFADILSAIESDEKIHLHQDWERRANGATIPAAIELPKNLFIIGTVNVDETTYMFSPKVLDRANVIEFRMDADELETFLYNPAKPELSKLDHKGASFGRAFVDATKDPADLSSEEMRGVKAAYNAEMLLLFKMLQAHGAEFGYRTAYEAARFIYFYKLLGNHPDGDTSWFPGAFDCVVFQKLLPKLHGSRAKLGPVLKKLWFLCVSDATRRGADALKAADEAARSTDKKAEPSVVVPAGAPYPLSAEKIGRMWRLLIENGFASFAEA
jgi:5-methylcytosine-specific restriction protein B